MIGVDLGGRRISKKTMDWVFEKEIELTNRVWAKIYPKVARSNYKIVRVEDVRAAYIEAAREMARELEAGQ